VRGVEGEPFAARLGNPAQFVVLEPGRPSPLAITRRYFGFAFAAFRQVVEGGDLPFQTT